MAFRTSAGTRCAGAVCSVHGNNGNKKEPWVPTVDELVTHVAAARAAEAIAAPPDLQASLRAARGPSATERRSWAALKLDKVAKFLRGQTRGFSTT